MTISEALVEDFKSEMTSTRKYLELVPEVIRNMKERGLDNVPVILGGIIPRADYEKMDQAVIQKVYAPKDYDLNKIMSEIADVVALANNIDLTS